MTGVELIAAERRRQIEQEGWTPEHDDEHSDGELAMAACYYAVVHEAAHFGPQIRIDLPALLYPKDWDWFWGKRAPEERQTNATRIRDLTKAGALIAAEIDRLQREAAAAQPTDQ
jgi:hypothetical protein